MKSIITLFLTVTVVFFSSAQCPTLAPGYEISLCPHPPVILASHMTPPQSPQAIDYYWAAPPTAQTVGSTTGTLTTNTAGIYTLVAVVRSNTACTSSAQFTVTACSGVGIAENVSADSYYSLYPNPTTGLFTFLSNQQAKTTLLNQWGFSISETPYEEGQHQVDLSEYSDGIYFLRIEFKDAHSKTIKVIKLNGN